MTWPVRLVARTPNIRRRAIIAVTVFIVLTVIVIVAGVLASCGRTPSPPTAAPATRTSTLAEPGDAR